MASAALTTTHAILLPALLNSAKASSPRSVSGLFLNKKKKNGRPGPRVVCAVGELSSGSTNYLIGGAILIALVGTAFPIIFSRKDLCPECDGAGFVRKTGARLNANAARKDAAQIVCPRCKGLGKLAQVDK